jgi:signal transduction histidine kinase
MGVLLAVFVVAAPFTRVQLPGNNAFIPIVQTVVFFGDLITAVLIYTKYSIVRSRALLVLASGYLFTALITVPHTLTFPGALAPDGVLGPALQTNGWLFIIWRFSLPAAVIGYVALSGRTNSKTKTQQRDYSIFWSVIIVIGLICAITWILLSAEPNLPRLFLDRITFAPLVPYTVLFDALVCGIVLWLLWFRQKSILDQWLSIAIFATVLEMVMVTFFVRVRFDVGWYTVRIFAVTAATVVLLALLAETMYLYAKLARTIQALKRERSVRLLSVEAATGAMAHEIRQSLTAIASTGEAGLTWMERKPLKLHEVRECLTSIVDEAHRANEVMTSVRRMFDTAGADQRTTFQVNFLIQETFVELEHDLQENDIVLTRDLADSLPRIHADRTQIHQLLLNLIKNAIEAMQSCSREKRFLRVATRRTEYSHVSINTRDSGPGISAEHQQRVFLPFFTTKQDGTGLGLPICKAIVERHDGTLELRQSESGGSSFEIILPSEMSAIGP